MSIARVLEQRWKWLLLIIPALVVVLVVAGTYAYIHFVATDPAPRLAFSSPSAGQASAAANDASATAAGAISGSWSATTGSKVQYRVQEVLNGQDNEATGATTSVIGKLAISGTTVSSASFTVDMTKFSSSEDVRDGQFQNRIMNTSRFPSATFELTSPIVLASIPDDLVEVTVRATGKLTLHGTTRDLTFDLKARRNGAQIEVNGTIPITFSDFKINNPSGGPASVGNNGDLEFLLVLSKT